MCAVRNFSIGKCIVSLELDRAGLDSCIARDRVQGQKWRELREERKKKKKEEETKLRRYRITTAIIPYVVFLFCVLRATVD